MPWCEDCAKYWTPNSMNDDGTCPRCERLLDAPSSEPSDRDDERAPWHFKLLVVALVVYLGWRFVDLVL